jgi:hypothetical protein
MSERVGKALYLSRPVKGVARVLLFRRFPVSRIDRYGYGKFYRPIPFFMEVFGMPKKDGSSRKTIEQVRSATLADIQRIAEKLLRAHRSTEVSRPASKP